MPRERSRDDIRSAIAVHAARLMAQDGIEDYGLAKRKAARRLGAAGTEALPGNDEIEAELRDYLALYQEAARRFESLATGLNPERAALLARLAEARATVDDLAVTTDIIVGFPGETEAEFEATLDLVCTVRFAQAYSFKYSPRPGTPAASLEDQVPEDVKSARLTRLQDLLFEQQTSFNSQCVGKTLPGLQSPAGSKAQRTSCMASRSISPNIFGM